MSAISCALAVDSGLLRQFDIDAQFALFQIQPHAEIGELERMKQFSNWLIDSGVLTRWQCEKLLSGRWRSFFTDGYKLLERFDADHQSSCYRAEVVATGQHVVMRVTPKKDRDENTLPSNTSSSGISRKATA